MKIHTSTTNPTTSFPILLQTRERERWNAPTDIWQGTYVQGPTIDEDFLDGSWTKIAARRRINEHHPCFTSTGEPAYVRSDDKRPGLFVGNQAVVPGALEQACFSQDGQLGYVREGELWLARADGSQARQVTTSSCEGPVNDLEFSADGRHLWYCAGTNLFRYEAATARLESVATRQLVTEFSLAPEERALVYLDDNNGLHRLDLDQPFAERETKLAQIPLETYLADYIHLNNVASPTFTPDGSRVLFTVDAERFTGVDWENNHAYTLATLWAVPSRAWAEPIQLTQDENVSGIAVPRAVPGRLAA